MKLKFNGELSHKTSLEEERERIMIWICLLVCFSIYWDLLILFTIYNISCIYFLHFPPKKSMIQIRKNFFFFVRRSQSWKVACGSFVYEFLFCSFPFSSSFKIHIGEVWTFLFSWNKYVTCWYVKKQAVFWKWGAFKIFGSDKLIFKSTRKSYSVICCVL